MLPIRSLSQDSADVRLAIGIHEELIAALSKLRQLRLTARYSVMRYSADSGDARAIGSELGVRFLLAGTLQREGIQPRIQVRLLDTRTDEQLWAETYVWDRPDILSMPRAVAAKVAEELQAELSPTERADVAALPTTNLAAYEYFLRGNEYSRAHDWTSSWGPALEMYQKAVGADPSFAMAYAALGVQHLRFYWWNRDRSPERLTRAREAIEAASRLNPGAPEVQRAWGYYYFWGHRDYARALKLVQNARKARPSDADAIALTAGLHRRLGAYSAAVKDLQEAWELDPLNLFLGQTLAETYTGLRRFPEAVAVLDELIRRDQKDGIYDRHKAFLHIFWAGDTARARAILDAAEQRLGRDARFLPHARFLLNFYRGDLRAATQYAEAHGFRFDLTGQQDDVYDVQRDLTRAALYALASRRDEARGLFGVVRTKLEAAPERPTPGGKHLYYAQAYAGLGQREGALREAALAEQSLQRTADEWERGHFMEMLLPVYIMIREHDLAIDRIERLLTTQYYEGLTVAELHLDPRLDPLRRNPRFQALLAKYESASRR